VNKYLNKKSAVLTLVAVGVLGGGAAFAYPPSVAITVSAATPTPGQVVVTVDNANPGCGTQIELDGTVITTIPASHSTTTNTVTTTLTTPGLSGRHSVSARTVGCTKGSKEHAKTKFVVVTPSNHVTYPQGDTPATGNYSVKFSGLDPATTTVSVIATGPGKQDTDSDGIDRRGEATLKVKLKPAGTWTIVTSINVNGTITTETKTVVVH
jgi:hypothetical protein